MDTPSFLWKEVSPKGRRLDGDSGMKKSGEMRLKSAINESTRAPLTRSPFPNGEGYETRIPLSPKHSLPREGKAKRTGAERPITICGEAAATTLNLEP